MWPFFFFKGWPILVLNHKTQGCVVNKITKSATAFIIEDVFQGQN